VEYVHTYIHFILLKQDKKHSRRTHLGELDGKVIIIIIIIIIIITPSPSLLLCICVLILFVVTFHAIAS